MTSRKSTSSNPPHRAELSFVYDDVTLARRVTESVRPEVGDVPGDRTTARITRDGPEVVLTVTAADLGGLRAALSTWTTLVDVAERSVE